jgi:GH24 family phage-related lysozyme (muramidase)
MSGATKLDTAGEKFIAGWEGGQSADGLYHAYYDEYGKVWTIGIGETHVDGHDVTPGMVWTPAQAYADLSDTFSRDYAPAINDLGVELNQNQFNALASYVWNCGPGALELYGIAPSLKAKRWTQAAQAMLKPDSAGGVVLGGLVTRRRAESMLFLTPEPKPVNPYALYPTTLESYGGYKFDEEKLAKRIDAGLEHPHLHHHELELDLPVAKAAKTRIWVVSVYAPSVFKTKRDKPDWGDGRGDRYQLWASRIARMEKTLA